MMQSDVHEKEFLEKYKGQILEVLYEEGREGVHTGYTRNYLKVRVISGENIQGMYLKTRILGLEDTDLLGEVLDQ